MNFARVLFVLLFSVGSMAWSQPKYSIAEIPPVGGSDVSKSSRISNTGIVVGWSEGPGPLKPLIYRNGISNQIGGGSVGYALGVNDLGMVVGTDQGPKYSQAALIGDFNAVQLVYGYPVLGSTALGINNNGMTVGEALFYLPGYGPQAFATVDKVAKQLPLPTSFLSTTAYDVNDSGLIVGCGGSYYGTFALTWLDGVVRVLANPTAITYACARAVNASGEIVGYGPNDVVVWSGEVGRNIGRVPGSTKSIGLDINDDGWIVGQFNTSEGTGAFLYKRGKFYDLATTLTNGSGWTLSYANGINNSGRIVGTGTFNGKTRAFILTPEYVP